MNATLNIPVNIVHNRTTGFTYVEDSKFDASVYSHSINAAKAKLRAMLQKEISDALEEQRNYQRRVIATKNGEVLVVYFRHGNWGYDIARAGQTLCSSCWGNGGTFEEAVELAKNHAEQSYGGVLWGA